MTVRITCAPSAEQWPAMALNRIMVLITEAVAARGHCYAMLTGGNTAARLYDHWRSVGGVQALPLTLYFGDERCVPPEDPESNFGLAQRRLFPDGLPPGVTVHRMRGELTDRERAAAAYAALLPPALDLVLLGLGQDGHIASLFPGSPLLEERVRRVAPAIGPNPPRERLTVTPPVFIEARHLLLLAPGETKASVLAQSLVTPTDIATLPVRLTLSGEWLLDPASYAKISSGLGLNSLPGFGSFDAN